MIFSKEGYYVLVIVEHQNLKAEHQKRLLFSKTIATIGSILEADYVSITIMNAMNNNNNNNSKKKTTTTQTTVIKRFKGIPLKENTTPKQG